MPAQSPSGALDPINSLRGFLALDSLVRLVLWSLAGFMSFWIISRLGWWPDKPLIGGGFTTTWLWFFVLNLAVILFNNFYVILLLLLRLPIPTPRQGRYVLKPGKPIDRQLIWACLIGALTKARYEPPFPGFLVHHASSLPPLCWLYNTIYGPKNASCNVTDVKFADPYAIEVGRNVVFGYGAVISAHAQGRDEIIISKTTIEDNVIVGGNVLVYDGCTIKQGAVILGGAVLKSNSVIGENEVWGGIPARKIKTLPPYGRPMTAGDGISV